MLAPVKRLKTFPMETKRGTCGSPNDTCQRVNINSDSRICEYLKCDFAKFYRVSYFHGDIFKEMLKMGKKIYSRAKSCVVNALLR